MFIQFLTRVRHVPLRLVGTTPRCRVAAGTAAFVVTAVSVPTLCERDTRSSASTSSRTSAFIRSATADASAANAFATGVAAANVCAFTSAIRECEGTVHVSGVGKSGVVARRMAASLSSAGKPASYVHGTEWVHGDLGLLRPGDCIVTFSNSGETREIVNLMKYCCKQERGVKLIAVVGKPNSSMEALADCALVIPSLPAGSSELNGNIPTRSIIMQEMAVNAVLTDVVESSGFDVQSFLRNRPLGWIDTSKPTTNRPSRAPSSSSAQPPSTAFARSIVADASAANAFATHAAEAEVAELISTIHECQGTVHISGVGKSGIVGNRMAISLSSIGKPATYVHGTEWIHGDLGILKTGDCIVALSHSGETPELLDLMTITRNQERGVKLLAVVGTPGSSLERLSDSALVLPPIPGAHAELNEAIPTRSIVMQEMVVNAVLTELVEATGFDKDAFLRNHPGGSIGRVGSTAKR